NYIKNERFFLIKTFYISSCLIHQIDGLKNFEYETEDVLDHFFVLFLFDSINLFFFFFQLKGLESDFKQYIIDSNPKPYFLISTSDWILQQNEILDTIFSFLPIKSLVQAALVCKKWHERSKRFIYLVKNLFSFQFNNIAL